MKINSFSEIIEDDEYNFKFNSLLFDWLFDKCV